MNRMILSISILTPITSLFLVVMEDYAMGIQANSATAIFLNLFLSVFLSAFVSNAYCWFKIKLLPKVGHKLHRWNTQLIKYHHKQCCKLRFMLNSNMMKLYFQPTLTSHGEVSSLTLTPDC